MVLSAQCAPVACIGPLFLLVDESCLPGEIIFTGRY